MKSSKQLPEAGPPPGGLGSVCARRLRARSRGELWLMVTTLLENTVPFYKIMDCVLFWVFRCSFFIGLMIRFGLGTFSWDIL